MPFRRLTNDGPCSAYIRSSTSVSDVVRNTWPGSLQFLAQLDVVVDLAVEHDGVRPHGHRLVAGVQVDDRQAAVREGDATVGEEALVVGPAMAQD